MKVNLVLTPKEKQEYVKKGNEHKKVLKVLVDRIEELKNKCDKLKTQTYQLDTEVSNVYEQIKYDVFKNILPKTPEGILFCEECFLISKSFVKKYSTTNPIGYSEEIYEYECKICNKKESLFKTELKALELEIPPS